MKLEWLGQYRSFVRALMKFGNAYSRTYNDETRTGNISIELSAAQIQTMEYIMENEDKNQNMAEIATMLGMSASAFSKNVRKMTEKGLLEKYQTSTNRKDIIVRVSESGKKVYEQYSKYALETVFSGMFHKLDTIPPEHIEAFAEILELAADATFKPNLPQFIKL